MSRRTAVLSALTAAILVAGAVPATAAAPEATTSVRINFDVGVRGQSMPAPPNLGDPDVVTAKLLKSGGDLIVAAGRAGNGRAADYPAYDGAESAARAVLTARDTDLADGDALSPGLQPFTFGADFVLDAVSTGTSYDNGNNLVQRGLAGSSDQFKIQVDSTSTGFRPSCAIAQKVSETETRTAAITSRAVIEPGRWYRVRCTRTATAQLRIDVTPFAADGSALPKVTDIRPGIASIDLTWPTEGLIAPFTVGGKVNLNGTIASQSDQFNGLVDNVLLTVG